MQAQLFTESPALAMRKYQNRAIETARVIEALIARETRDVQARGHALDLNDDELASCSFALATLR